MTNPGNMFRSQVIAAVLSSSRTAQGVSDTSSSPHKRKLAISEEELRIKTGENVAAILDLFRGVVQRDAALTASEAHETLLQAARMVNRGAASENQQLYRTWNYSYPGSCPQTEVQTRLVTEFSPWLAAQLRSSSLAKSVRSVAANIEIQLNYVIHPFADGCGRISRTLAAAVLMREGYRPPDVSCLVEPGRSGHQIYYDTFAPPFDRWIGWYLQGCRRDTC